MKEILTKEKKMDLVNLFGIMEINMKAILKMIKKLEKELILGMMAESIKDNG